MIKTHLVDNFGVLPIFIFYVILDLVQCGR